MFAGKSKCLDPDQQLMVIIDGVYNEINWMRGNVPLLSYLGLSVVMIVVASIITAAASRSFGESVAYGSVISASLFTFAFWYEIYRMGSRCVAHEGKTRFRGGTRFCGSCYKVLRPDMAEAICRLYMKCKWLEQSDAKLGPATLNKEVVDELDWLKNQMSKF